MANYGYIHLPTPITPERLESLLVTAALNDLPMGWRVRRADWEDGGPTWMVELPGTATSDWREALQRGLAAGDDVGFLVSLQDDGKTIAFRHGPNHFERWAQGCTEEALADQLGVGVLYDATDDVRPPGTRRYRAASSWREYIALGFEKPLSAEDAAYIDGFKFYAPPGHW